MNILVDMNLSPRWVEWLRDAGLQAVHWSALGPANAPDSALFAYAARHDFVILTHDLDFGAMLAAGGGGKPSVLQIRGLDLRPEMAGRHILTAMQQANAELTAGALVSLDTHRTRIRLLPFA